MKNVKLLFAALLVAGAGLAGALDTPHDGTASSSVRDCLDCHQLHGGGGTLTKYPANNDACLTCHDSVVPGPDSSHFFTGAWASPGREATPGTGGDQHNWSGLPTGHGARVPANADMAKYLPAGSKLQCAVCHDPHGKKDPATGVPNQEKLAPRSAHSSYKLGVAIPPDGGGAGRMKVVTVTDTFDPPWEAIPQAYAIRIRAGGTSFEISHDYKKLGAAATWVGAIPFTVGDLDANNVYLDDNVVQVRFTSAPAAGNIWQFYVSYPFLRASNVANAMCTDCHVDRHQSWQNVNGVGPLTGTGGGIVLGTTVFSHPVGQPLNDNLKNTDIASGVPLDADGSATSSTTDGLVAGVPAPNPGNDLKLDVDDGNKVRCTSCHAPHNASSNSYNVEVR